MTILVSENSKLIALCGRHIENFTAVSSLNELHQELLIPDFECDLLIIDFLSVENYVEELVNWLITMNIFVRKILFIKDSLPCASVCKTARNDIHIRVCEQLKKAKYFHTTICSSTFKKTIKIIHK